MITKKPGQNLSLIYMGNFLDFFEFSMFATVFPFLSKIFFPQISHGLSVVLSFLLFSVGFMARPLGVLLLGGLGDKINRRTLLSLSIFGISFSTLLMAFAPAYEYFGYLGAIKITAGRILQGIFTGAEYAASSTYVYEQSGAQNRSVTELIASGILGVVISQLLAAILHTYDLLEPGWRFLFAFVSLFGLWLSYSRLKNLHEIPIAELTYEQPMKSTAQLFVSCLLIAGISNGLFHYVTQYFYSHVMLTQNQDPRISFVLNATLSFFCAVFLMFWGHQKVIFLPLSLKSLKRSLTILLGVIIIHGLSLIFKLGTIVVFFTQILLILSFQMLTYVAMTYMPGFFHPTRRIRTFGLAIALGNSLLGGASPYFCSQVTYLTGVENAAVYYFTALILLSYFGLKGVCDGQYRDN